MKKIEWGSLKNFDDVKRLFRDNKELIKTAALPLVIGAAVLFFWFYGVQNSDIEVQDEGADVENTVFSEDNEKDIYYNSIMYVDISGEVITPGVYEVSDGTRLFQVIEMAGGLTENADLNSLNQAEIVYDGQKIIVSSGGDNSDYSIIHEKGSPADKGITNGKVNLNMADSATLQTIPGIGPSKAERILEYRNASGRFKRIEDIMNITGIGQKTFESIRDYITV